ncbi:MAG: glycosyltransferase [Elusimicrobia bacterium]|nr:glycosyltransferase [Elusimicrobiota bacterium]
MGMRTGIKGAACVYTAILAFGVLGGLPLKAGAKEVLVAMPMAAENKRTAFRQSMRKLWADHVIWTRSYIVAAVAGTPDTAETASRLLRNQAEIGAAFVPYYGEAIGAKLSQLVKEHILISADVVGALKKGDDAKFQDADMRWHANAVEIAVLLNGANPNWSKEAYVEMFNSHLALTTKEATARILKRWPDDIAAFDELYVKTMLMADDLADGVIKQFPEKI